MITRWEEIASMWQSMRGNTVAEARAKLCAKTCADRENLQMRKNDRRECLFPAFEELQSGPNPIGVHFKSKQALSVSSRSG